MTEIHHAFEKIIMLTFVMDNIDYVVYVVIILSMLLCMHE